MKGYSFIRLIFVAIIIAGLSCNSDESNIHQSRERWIITTLHRIDSKIQAVCFGDLGPSSLPHLALAAADGRCLVLWNGKKGWENRLAFQYPRGLSAITIGDGDPASPGNEIWVGGSDGSVHELCLMRDGSFTNRLYFEAGAATGDLVVHDLDPGSPGSELLLVTEGGEAVVIRPAFDEDEGPSRSQVVMKDTARLRCAIAGPFGPQGRPAALFVGYSGRLTRIYLEEGDWRIQNLYESSIPLARISAGQVDPSSEEPELVVVDDSGKVVLLTPEGGAYRPSTVHQEEEALRGVTVADFEPDAPGEEIAVFGYGMEVPLYIRTVSGLERKVLFRDSDRGHWLIHGQVIPLSPRFELVAVGYSGKISLIHFN